MEGFELEHDLPVRNQGDVNCCVPCALAVCMEALQAGPLQPLSPLFSYFATRDAHLQYSTADHRQTIEVADALLAAADLGIAPEQAHAPTIGVLSARRRPNEAAFEAALGHRIAPSDFLGTGGYRRIDDSDPLVWVKSLESGAPLIVGVRESEGYWRLRELDPAVHPHSLGSTSVSRHAVAVLGFSDGDREFFIKDSRGASFGLEGCWRLPFDLLGPAITEAWAIERLQ